MWTSGGGSTYSSSRLSSLWLLVHSDTLPCLCKTVLFLQPPKGVQQWLNTPKWPYQLFYYFSCEGGGGRNIVSAKTEFHPSLVPSDYAKSSDTFLPQKKENKRWFDPTAQVPLISRSFVKSILTFCSLEFKAGKHHLYWMNHHNVINVVTELMTEVCEYHNIKIRQGSTTKGEEAFQC